MYESITVALFSSFLLCDVLCSRSQRERERWTNNEARGALMAFPCKCVEPAAGVTHIYLFAHTQRARGVCIYVYKCIKRAHIKINRGRKYTNNINLFARWHLKQKPFLLISSLDHATYHGMGMQCATAGDHLQWADVFACNYTRTRRKRVQLFVN